MQSETIWTAFVNMIASVRRDLCGCYRPERHYMRGPGPACRAKQAIG